jgi:hypothetical protein
MVKREAAERMAEATPTASAVYNRAAIIQKTNPKRAFARIR